MELGKDITVVKPGMLIEIDDIKVKTIEAYNKKHAGDTKLMHTKGIGVGYVISLESKNIYHAGDTDLVQEMDCLQDIDVAFLPIGGRDFTMDLSQAIQAVKRIKPKVVIPVHRFENDPDEYKKLVEKESLTKVVVLQIGETYRL
jgi:L-ascorbate metabolism protein UlaG (beta-lactamase superfamily)